MPRSGPVDRCRVNVRPDTGSVTGGPSRIAQRRSAALAEGGADYNARRAELIRVAADVFRGKGYAASTLHDIAVATRCSA